MGLSRDLARRCAGYAWLASWCAVLYAVAAPWRRLGGLEPELLRWLEWWALCGGLAVGYAAGRAARDWALGGIGRTCAAALRVVFYPPTLLTAVALVVLSIAGERGPIGVAVTAFLSYWAGMDVALGAVPMMDGRSYRLLRPLDPEAAAEDDDAARATRVRWDRF